MSSTIFGKEITQQNQPTLFGAPLPKTINEEQKTNISSSLFNNEKQTIFGGLFNQKGNNEQKDNQENKTQNTLFGSGVSKNLFSFTNKNEKDKESNNQTNLNQGGLFGFDIASSENKKKENENSNILFKSPGEKKDISKNLFQNANKENKKDINFINFEDRKAKEEKQPIEHRIINNTPKLDGKAIIFPIKKENKNNIKGNSFEISTSLNPKTNPIDVNVNVSEKNTISTNQNSNNITSTKRIEDDDQVQNALQNLYISDILLPSPFNYKSPSLTNKEIVGKNKYNNKKSKTIDFKFFVEIKDMPNIKDEGCNMMCKSDESMGKLMKQSQLYIKRKYRMAKELNDFKISLMKNGYKLPISDKELIGDYIKNNDKIIIYLVHNSSLQNEDNKMYPNNNIKNEEKKEIVKVQDNNLEIEIKNNNNIIEEKEILNSSNDMKDINKNELIKIGEEDILCPTDKLPILKRQGYFMNPDEYTISRMTLNEIKNVKNFSIFNENGKIEFEGKVSLYGANLDKLFNIEHEFIEYEKGEWCHSPRGQNFNVPAVITFYNVQSNIDVSNDNEKKLFIETLKIKCQKYLNAKFISYDFDNGTLIYKIPYFY